jgi:competence protein ComEA
VHSISSVVGNLYKENDMRKLLLLIVTFFVMTGVANAEVNINSATQSELEMLQGIGPAKAKAIIEYREKNGSFESVNDLEKVNGIGSETIKQLGDNVTVGGYDDAMEKTSVFAYADRKHCQHRGQC